MTIAIPNDFMGGYAAEQLRDYLFLATVLRRGRDDDELVFWESELSSLPVENDSFKAHADYVIGRGWLIRLRVETHEKMTYVVYAFTEAGVKATLERHGARVPFPHFDAQPKGR